MDEKTAKNVLQAIEDILKRGNDVVIRRKGDKIVVFEEKKTIKYSA